MKDRQHALKYLSDLSSCPMVDRSIGTLDYMLERNPMNDAQHEALVTALDALKTIKALR